MGGFELPCQIPDHGVANVRAENWSGYCGTISQGWLHDEWLAIVAAAVDEIDVIAEPLIDYRHTDTIRIGVRALTAREKSVRMIEPGHERKQLTARWSRSLALQASGIIRAVVPAHEAARQKVLRRSMSFLLSP
jgi:hypothetical protein